MQLELSEWEARDDLELSPEQIAVFASSHAVDVTPTGGGRWRLKAKHHVGVLHAPNLELRISPKVSVHRLVALLCETIERVEWHDTDTLWAESDDLLTTIAGSFCSQAERAIQQGLLQGYRTIDDSIFGIKGRFDVGAQLSRRAGLVLPVEVTYDDYSVDIVENQLLAGATLLLLKLPNVPDTLRGRLRRLQQTLVESTPTQASTSPPSVAWSRLNLRYRPAVTLANLVLRSCALEEGSDRPTTGTDFLVDMNKVFEDVVGEGLKRLVEARHGGIVHLQSNDYLDLGRTIAIRPDIVWEMGGSVAAVADVKYKNPDRRGIGTSDIYQAVAYATRYGLDRCHLIYASAPPQDRVVVRDVAVHMHQLSLDQDADHRQENLAEIASALVQ